jgi:hypothetical protein
VQLAGWLAVSPKILVTVTKGSNAPLDMAICSLVVATNILQELEFFIFMVKKILVPLKWRQQFSPDTVFCETERRDFTQNCNIY